MASLEDYLLTCPKDSFEKLYLDGLDADLENFGKYEKVRCIRHVSLYDIVTSNHKKRPAKNSEH